jgi:hypothetical protein
MLEFRGASNGGGLQGGCRATARKHRNNNNKKAAFVSTMTSQALTSFTHHPKSATEIGS